jgi:glycosyltransferase involved in cell wall biosynthesis
VRILYLSLSYIPSRRASSVQVMKMCSALARRGHDVTLVAKRGVPISDQDDHAFYNVDRNFAVRKIVRPRPRGGGFVYAATMAYELIRRRDVELVYCRDPVGALAAAELGMPLVFEAHGIPTARGWQRVYRRIAASKRSRGVVAITEALRRDLVSLGVTSQIVVAPDACDPPRAPVRAAISTPPRIGYVGSLYAGRGIETIIALARVMPGCDFAIVGGQPADVERWQASGIPRNVELLGFRPQAELASHYATFDVVLMPHATAGVAGASGGEITRWTSPMKMFEYMASGVAIVASDLPVFHEVLEHRRNALLVPSDDVEAWRSAVQQLLAEPQLRSRLAATAQHELAQRYTWEARAKAVMTELGLE